ncbi:VWA domain-containing protein [Nioella sp. MMSF_3534]|uniref:vWA domain-containing protein n=1 Tax=Nioella sp. MMSF_3534 TaxID=3046720 RepID=UPI00273E2AFE|nr:VWA domain-containing protein [Nioella sp. MMSF_3534]
MNDMIDFDAFDAEDFADNPEPRCPCVLVLDCSYSMTSNGAIDELNRGIETFKSAIEGNDLAAKRVEVAIVSFGANVDISQEFTTVDGFSPSPLVANGATPMGAALEQAVDLVAQRRQTYRSHAIKSYKPWIFLITDGAPTDDVTSAIARISDGEDNRAFTFFAVGVDQADMNVLSRISTKRAPLKLRGIAFEELFQWLSDSLTQVSSDDPGTDSVALPQVSWAAT